MNYLLDTNAILYFLEGRAEKLPLEANDNLFISFITKIELLSYDLSSKEKNIIDRLLANYEIIYVDDSLIELTVHIRRDHGLKLPDSIIVATAMQCDATVVTADKQILKKALDINIKAVTPLP